MSEEITEIFRKNLTYRFSAAHRLTSSFNESEKCIHGHDYKVDIVFQSDELNQDGEIFNSDFIYQICENRLGVFNNGLILFNHDPLIEKGIEKIVKKEVSPIINIGLIPVPFKPTNENLAKFFFEYIESILYANEDLRCIQIVSVRISTGDEWAEYKKY